MCRNTQLQHASKMDSYVLSHHVEVCIFSRLLQLRYTRSKRAHPVEQNRHELVRRVVRSRRCSPVLEPLLTLFNEMAFQAKAVVLFLCRCRVRIVYERTIRLANATLATDCVFLYQRTEFIVLLFTAKIFHCVTIKCKHFFALSFFVI